jgi:hypothetical protein
MRGTLAALVALLSLAEPCSAARNFNGSSQYLQADIPIVGDYPFTISIWFYPVDSSNGIMYSISDTGSCVTAHYLAYIGSLGGSVQIVSGLNSSYAQAFSSTNAAVNEWHLATGVFASATNHIIYLDGGSAGADTTNNITPTSLDVTNIGDLNCGGSITSPFSGNLTRAAVWRGILSPGEIAALARRTPPRALHPAAATLISYEPLYGSGPVEPDLIGRASMTVAGATHAEDVAMLPEPLPPKIRAVDAAAATGYAWAEWYTQRRSVPEDEGIGASASGIPVGRREEIPCLGCE